MPTSSTTTGNIDNVSTEDTFNNFGPFARTRLQSTWNTENTIYENVMHVKSSKMLVFFLEIVDPEKEFFHDHYGIIQNTFIFSKGDILKSYVLPKNDWDSSSAIAFIKWLSTIKLLLKK